MDVIVTLRKEEICSVIIRNVPHDHVRKPQEWLELAMSARGKDWEEQDIEVYVIERVPSGSDDMPEVEFKELKAV